MKKSQITIRKTLILHRKTSFCLQNPHIDKVKIISIPRKLLYISSITSILFISIYTTCLLRYNNLSSSYKIYLFSNKINKILGEYLSNKLQSEFSLLDSTSKEHILAETLLISMKPILNFKENDLKIKVKVINIPSFGCILFDNGDLYISSLLIKSVDYNESMLKVFVLCEIVNFLMGNLPLRNLKMIYYEMIYPDIGYKKKFLSENDKEFTEKQGKSNGIRLFNNKNDRLTLGFKSSSLSFYSRSMMSKSQRLNKYFLFYPENSFILNKHDKYSVIKESMSLLFKLASFEKTVFDLSSLDGIRRFDSRLEYYDQSFYINNNEESNYLIFMNVLDKYFR